MARHCKSRYWAIIPGFAKDGPLHHQCSGSSNGRGGIHYCGCGHQWSDTDACPDTPHEHGTEEAQAR